MAQTADNSLEGRVAALEQWQRAQQNVAAVVGSSVAATNPAQLEIDGHNAVSELLPWNYAGPSVDLYVPGGRLTVMLAAALSVNGINTTAYMGYEVRGPVTDQSLLPGAQLVGPTLEKSLSLEDHGSAQGTQGSISTFDLVTGLAVGWYRVNAAYTLGYTSQGGGTAPIPLALVTNRRVSVIRY